MREWTEKHIRELVRQEAEGLDLCGESSAKPYRYWELTDPFRFETSTKDTKIFYYEYDEFGRVMPQDIKCSIVLEEGENIDNWKEINAFYFFHEPEHKNITKYLEYGDATSMLFKMTKGDGFKDRVYDYLDKRYGASKWTAQDTKTNLQYQTSSVQPDALVYKTLDVSPSKISTTGELATVADIDRLTYSFIGKTPDQFLMKHNCRFYLENIEKYFMYVQRFMLISVTK